MTKVNPTIEISRRATLARLDRALRREHQQLRAERRGRGSSDSYVIVDTKKGAVVAVEVDLEKLVQKLRVLKAWERMAG
jgi:hypothetical protein